MSINSIIRGFKAQSMQNIEMNALEHNHYILFAIKEFFVNGFSFKEISKADYRREQEIKDELSDIMLNIVTKFKIDSSIEFEQITEIYTSKKNFTINIERNANNIYYLVLHNNKNDCTEILVKVDDEFMQKCYEFVGSTTFFKKEFICDLILLEKNFNIIQFSMNKQLNEIKMRHPSLEIEESIENINKLNPILSEYDGVYGKFLRDFIIYLIKKEENNTHNQQLPLGIRA